MLARVFRLLTAAAVGIAGLVAVAVPSFAQTTIVIGSKGFTEQLLMAEMTSQLLAANGFKPDKRTGMGSAVLRQAIESGQIDVCWEYTGTSLITYNKISDRMSPADTYKKVKELDAAKGIVWLNPSKANNTYALAVRKKESPATAGINSLSQLAAAIKGGKHISFAVNAEFPGRPDGLPGLEKFYGFKWPLEDIKRMDTGLTYQALRDKQVDVALVFATDGRIAAFDFHVLKDDKNYFPPYALTPNVRKAVLDKNPKLADLLNKVSAKLDDQTMAHLNAMIDVDKKTVEEVAADFLRRQKLIAK
jgi:osmoprotectant transport system substrate-binding protein